MTLFQQIHRIAVSVAMPTAFRKDLTYHDRRALGNKTPGFPIMPGDDVLWIVQENGTHLIRRVRERDRINSHSKITRCLLGGQTFEGPKHVYRLNVTGTDRRGNALGTVKEITVDRALELAEDWDHASRPTLTEYVAVMA